jgi:hypothetical protein
MPTVDTPVASAAVATPVKEATKQEPEEKAPMQEELVVAKHAYQAQQAKQLSFSKHALIRVIQKKSNGWWLGHLLDSASRKSLALGWLPEGYVKPFVPAAGATSQASTPKVVTEFPQAARANKVPEGTGAAEAKNNTAESATVVAATTVEKKGAATMEAAPEASLPTGFSNAAPINRVVSVVLERKGRSLGMAVVAGKVCIFFIYVPSLSFFFLALLPFFFPRCSTLSTSPQWRALTRYFPPFL